MLQNDHEGIAKEEKAYVDLPEIAQVSLEDVQANYLRIKKEVAELVRIELDKLPERNGRQKGKGKRKEKRKKAIDPVDRARSM